MFAREAEREDGVDLVCIATPNHLHLPAALAAILAGVRIMSDRCWQSANSRCHFAEWPLGPKG